MALLREGGAGRQEKCPLLPAPGRAVLHLRPSSARSPGLQADAYFHGSFTDNKHDFYG